MNSKARITYRFDKQNGAREQREPDPDLQERPNKSNVVPIFQEELQFSSDKGTWNSPFQNDAHALEQLIRETDRQTVKGASQPSATPQDSRNTVKPAEPAHADPPQTVKPLEAKLSSWEDAYMASTPVYDAHDSLYHMPAAEEPFNGRPKTIQAHQPEIDLADLDEHERNPSVSQGNLSSFKTAANYRHGRNPSWYKVFASVTGAVVTGGLFGYFILALFAGGPPSTEDPGAGATVPTVEVGAGANAADNKDSQVAAVNSNGSNSTSGNQSGAAAGSSNIKVDIPESSYYMLQYGVFSNQEGLDAAVQELTAKGLAAASYADGEDYRVYVGMAADRNEALALGQTLTGMEVYIKQIDVPALSSIPYTGKPAEIEGFFKQTGELIRQMDESTLEKLNDASTGEASRWSELHQQWVKSASLVEKGVTDAQQKTALLKVIQQVNAASAAAGEYAKKPSDAHLWSMQNALMEAVFAQKAWFAAIDGL